MEINESLLKFYKLSAMTKNKIAFNFARSIFNNMDASYRIYLSQNESIWNVISTNDEPDKMIKQVESDWYVLSTESIWKNKLTDVVKNKIVIESNIEESWINDLFEIMNIACKLDYDPEEMEQHHKKYNI